MSSSFKTFLIIVLCIFTFVTVVENIGNSETTSEKPAISDHLYGNEKVILSVSNKLNINPGDVVFELDNKGEPYYVTPAGTYYAEFKGDEDGDLEVDYLHEK